MVTKSRSVREKDFAHSSNSLGIRPKFLLGKLKSKYHILDILGYSDYFDDACDKLKYSCRTLRKLLTENYSIALYRIPKEPIEVSYFR